MRFLCFLLAAHVSARLLHIQTTFEAEDYGLEVEEHHQCKAWALWKRTQEQNIELSSDNIDLLAIRRVEVDVNSVRDARKFQVPEELFSNYTTIRVNFKNLCRFHPRILKVNSRFNARRYGVNVDYLCSNSSILEEEPFELQLNSTDEAYENSVSVTDTVFRNHKNLVVMVPAVCEDNLSGDNQMLFQYYEEKYGPFMLNVSNLGMEIDKLHEFMRNTENIDNIMRKFDTTKMVDRPLPTSTILPFLKKVQYDSRIPPTLHVDDTVIVKVGLRIESMSDFELSTMDHEIDTWIRMSWLDPRLRTGLSRPVLVNDYTFLKLLWRPDPTFINSKLSTFHKVSYLNFYMFIFPDGEVFMDVRLYLKPISTRIVLCKYPHDSPSTNLMITSSGFTKDVVTFEWFSDIADAVQLNPLLKISDMKIMKIDTDVCDGSRKSGNYSCIETKFYMQRFISYHIVNTYIPTAICVIFSWISVWLPEEFVEGRIFVSLTVFLTLSAENNSAKEELPKVSYVKAIDIWFGFTSSFVFVTMIQALIVISLEHNSKKMFDKSEKNLEQYGKYEMTRTLLLSRHYHRLARNIDTFCKIMYPVTFLLFLMIYGFVIIQGDEKKCITP